MFWNEKISNQKHRAFSIIRFKCPWVEMTSEFPHLLAWLTDLVTKRRLLRLLSRWIARMLTVWLQQVGCRTGFISSAHELLMWGWYEKTLAEPEKHWHAQALWAKVLCSSFLCCLCVWCCNFLQLANCRLSRKENGKKHYISYSFQRLHSENRSASHVECVSHFNIRIFFFCY